MLAPQWSPLFFRSRIATFVLQSSVSFTLFGCSSAREATRWLTINNGSHISKRLSASTCQAATLNLTLLPSFLISAL